MTYLNIVFSEYLEGISKLACECKSSDRKIWILLDAHASPSTIQSANSIVRWIEDSSGNLIHRTGGTLAYRLSFQTDSVPFKMDSYEESLCKYMEWASTAPESIREQFFAVTRVCGAEIHEADDDKDFKSSCGQCERCLQLIQVAESYGIYDLSL